MNITLKAKPRINCTRKEELHINLTCKHTKVLNTLFNTLNTAIRTRQFNKRIVA